MKYKSIVKKALLPVLAFILAAGFVCLPMAVNAADAVKLNVSHASGAAGDTVDVTLNITKNSGLAAAEFLLKYDNTKLTYKSNTLGSAASGGMSSVNPEYKTEGNISTINFSFIHAEGLTAGGAMLNVKFEINPGWEGSSAVELTVGDFANINYATIASVITNGTVKAVPAVTSAAGENISTVPSSVNDSHTAAGTTVSQSTSAETATITQTSASAADTVTTTAGNTLSDSNSSGKMISAAVIAALVIIAIFVVIYIFKKKK